MTQAGCPLQASAVYKTEKTGRRIVVQELIGYSKVFGIAIEDLLLAPEVAARKALRAKVRELERARQAAELAAQKAEALAAELTEAATNLQDAELRQIDFALRDRRHEHEEG
jgi:hypothetical protein